MFAPCEMQSFIVCLDECRGRRQGDGAQGDEALEGADEG
jgi:hypothetical protein